MDEKKQKKVIQMTANLDEFKVIKAVSAIGGFESISDYIRSLVTADISAKKRASKTPIIFAGPTMREYDWENLSDSEREQFMSQIGPVKPNGFEYLVKKMKGQIYDDIPVFGDDYKKEDNELL